MGLIAPGTYIAPPSITGHRFGLFSVAALPDDGGRWQLGVEYEPLTGQPADLRASQCVDDYIGFDLNIPEIGLVDGIPFVVVGSYACNSASRPLEEAEERARLALIGGEERAVEQAVMTAAAGNAPTLQGAIDLTAGGPVSMTEAFARFEGALGINHHSAGVIHMPRKLASYAYRDSLMFREGGRLETVLGTAVAAGAGYELNNMGPTGQFTAPSQPFLYATGPVTIRRGEIWVQPDESKYLNRDDNEVVILAQRDYLVTFAGPVYAAQVDLEVWEDCPCVVEEPLNGPA